MQTDKKQAHERVSLISVKGGKEGELEIAQYPTKLTCSFGVSLTSEKSNEALHVLYRLRVKESSILFSRTYGLLGHDSAGHPHPSLNDAITLYAQPAVRTMGKLSTIRVEYVTIDEAEANGLIERGEVEKEFCRPFFTKGDTKHYEVKCTFYDAIAASAEKKEGRDGGKNSHARSRAATLTAAVAVVAVVAAGVVVARRRGVTWDTMRHLLPHRFNRR
ncbi:hypothetical protein ABB37_06276 [Leptomonas pyrrhocoris]|uniref:Uncharacterized protein n=1 Tax=Leptomonas pyrrhocoris TaxID=157538 RepID=A0A0M9FYU7_LEPPY|nr:hypothetical protein ABB37_06276 [Leptomonas pyrrhocoris]KPA78676.1 hypothetical protein ABB37_06276 [Leptomonas pyrrhocoris]|eukprot:XP_015657115.1 hypothetical protein ABB37_06276 [Leptomonas pyrrhocoris]